MLKLQEMQLNLMKQKCALAEKDFKIAKLKEDIKRIEHEKELQADSIEELENEIKNFKE